MAKGIANETAKGSVKHFQILFGLFFLIIPTVVCTYGLFPTLYDAWRMRQWQPVEAQLIQADLEIDRSEVTTYRVTALYRYRWEGLSYSGQRVGINTISDNIGAWQKRTYSRLAQSGTISVWVNPEAPYEAVIDRDLRWGLLIFIAMFAVVPGVVGIVIIYSALSQRYSSATDSRRTTKEISKIAEPILPEGRLHFVGLAFFGVGFGIFSFLIVTRYGTALIPGVGDKWFLLFFPLAALIALYKSVQLWHRWRRFGSTKLNLRPWPAQVGSAVAGIIELPYLPGDIASVRLVLKCLHLYAGRNGQSDMWERKVLWHEEKQSRILASMEGVRVEFHFTPPATLPPSSEGDDHHKWILSMEGDDSCTALALEFNLPVVAAAGNKERVDF